MSNPARPFVPGIYVPIITIFHDDDEQNVDYETHKEHILYMARGGVQGFVSLGSTAEAVALNLADKAEITRVTRQVLDENGYNHLPIIVGASGQSTKEAIVLAQHAHKAGGDFIITLPPSYFSGSLNTAALESYYSELADKSPLPVIIYSYPAVCAGLELTSEAVARLAKHPKIVGIKQTDHNIGKMARIVHECPGFYVLGGASDYLLAALSVGAYGTVTGLANIFPRLCVHLFSLYTQTVSGLGPNTANPNEPLSVASALRTVQQLQGKISACEWYLLQGGIPSIKYACKHFLGRGGVPRRPVPESSDEVKKRIEDGLAPLMEMEKKLERGDTNLL